MNEKKAIERATAEAFLDHYNQTHTTSFRITEHGDAPDIVACDEDGNRPSENRFYVLRPGYAPTAVATNKPAIVPKIILFINSSMQ
jgi:hypothetical protein